jgi:hypothetical protein
MDQTMSKCEHCGMWHSGVCPRIKAIEYHPNGTVKRVGYHSEAGKAHPAPEAAPDDRR